MTVVTLPGKAETEKTRDLDRRVSDLEALIEEARRRARRRRARNGTAALLLVAVGVVALIGFVGDGGGGAGSAAIARARGPQGSTANAGSLPLGALPPGAGLVESFAFDPRNPQIVYLLTNGFSNGTSHVFKTTDGGAHWHATAARGSGWVGGKEALAADPRHPGTLYAGTELAVYKTVDGGRSWLPSHRGLITPPRSEREKGWVTALAVDPANTNIVYAGSDRVSESTDGGHSWKTVFPPHPGRFPPDDVSALAIAATRPEAIYAIAGDFGPSSATPAYGRTSIYKSTDAGTTWQATTVVRGRGVAPTALAVDPRDPSTVYAAIGHRVMKTTNAGKTWQPVADGWQPTAYGLPISDIRGTCHCIFGGITRLAVDPRRSGTVYAALTQGGIYKTTNGGQTWIRSTSAGLLDYYTLAIDPARPATIYAAGQDQSGDGPRILRSTNGGRTWAIAR